MGRPSTGFSTTFSVSIGTILQYVVVVKQKTHERAIFSAEPFGRNHAARVASIPRGLGALDRKRRPPAYFFLPRPSGINRIGEVLTPLVSFQYSQRRIREGGV
jgi:hypothetical protein